MNSLLLMAVLTAGPGLGDSVHQLTLKNGMTWLVVERHQAPVFTGFVRLRVGGIDEEQGFTGLAHLFEHMAFKGTPMIGTSDWPREQRLLASIRTTGDALSDELRRDAPDAERVKALKAELHRLTDEHKGITDENALSRLYLTHGGVGLNATTDTDLTSYFISLPSNQLKLWLTVEAQRLATPVLRDFYTERDVVAEERAMRIDSNPGGLLYQELNHLAFTSSPYRWPVVGYPKDLATMRLSDAEKFWQLHYAPANAVGCIVGDVDVKTLAPQLEETFGSLPAREAAPAPRFAEPESRAQRRATVFYDAAPRMMFAFRKPKAPSQTDDTVDVIETVLGEGRTGRLQRRLVYLDKIAANVGVFTGPGSRFDNLLIVAVTPLAGTKPEELERVIWEELGRLKTEPIGADEFEKVRNRLSVDTARQFQDNGSIAGALSAYQALFGDWRYGVDRAARIDALTVNDVMEVSKRLFTPENSVVLTLQRPVKAGAK